MVGQYFLATDPPPPNVYFPDESVCSASPAMFKCEISVCAGAGARANDKKQT